MALHDRSFGTRINTTEWGNTTTTVSISQKIPDYIRKLFYHNFTYTDVWIVDRSNRPVYVPGKGPDGELNTGFKVKIEREYTQSSGREVLENLERLSKMRELTDDEALDLEQLNIQFSRGNRCIRVEKSITINLAELNNSGYYYCSELDVIIYEKNYLKEKVFPYDLFNEVKLEEPKVIEKPVFAGNFDIIVVDNERTYDQVFTKVFGQVIRIPITKDSFVSSGIYIKVNPANKINGLISPIQTKEMKGTTYDYYELDKLQELGLYTNQSEAKHHERLTADRSIELENLRHSNKKLSLEIENIKQENEKELAKIEHDKRILEHDLKSQELKLTAEHKERMSSLELSYKEEISKKDLELRALKVEFDKIKMQNSLDTYQTKANTEIEVMNAKAANEITKLTTSETMANLERIRKENELWIMKRKAKMEEERALKKHQLDMSMMELEYGLKVKDQELKNIKFDTEIINALSKQEEAKYKEVQDVTKLSSGVADLLKLSFSLLL